MDNAVQAKSDQTDVLVVDDDVAIVDQLVECFRLSGISCASATDPIDALRMLHEGLNPAVVLTDLRMPDLDGLGLASRLVQLPHGHRPEIIFVSGHANLQDAIEAMQVELLVELALVAARGLRRVLVLTEDDDGRDGQKSHHSGSGS